MCRDLRPGGFAPLGPMLVQDTPNAVTPLQHDLAFGCRIGGVTLKALQDEAIRQQIRDAFEAHGMIVFEGMEPSNAMQVELSLLFGPLKEHPVAAVDRPDPDSMGGAIRVITDPDTAAIVAGDTGETAHFFSRRGEGANANALALATFGHCRRNCCCHEQDGIDLVVQEILDFSIGYIDLICRINDNMVACLRQLGGK